MKNPGHTRLRILLFEDNKLLRSVMCRLLREQHWEVICYPDPEGCPLRHATKCTCSRTQVCADVIVSDLEMPHIDGFTFLHDLLETGCKVPFVAMFTACEDEARLAPAKALGIVVFSKLVGLKPMLEWLRQVETRVDDKRLLTSKADSLRRLRNIR